jgi:hypothetical protein
MAAARVGHHSNSPFAPHSVSRKSTHPVGGSNRHPPEAVSYTTTEHFGQATGAISECYHSGAYIQTEALPRILVVLGWNRPFRHSTFGRFGQRHAKRLLLPRRGRRARHEPLGQANRVVNFIQTPLTDCRTFSRVSRCRTATRLSVQFAKWSPSGA